MLVNHLQTGYSDFLFDFLSSKNSLHLNMKILDVGCGHLRHLKLLEQLGFKNLYGIDKRPLSNPQKVQSFTYKKLDLDKEDIPYPDGSFDVVICNFVLNFIQPTRQKVVLQELMRVTNRHLLLETYPYDRKERKTTHYQSYSFEGYIDTIDEDPRFSIVKKRYFPKKRTEKLWCVKKGER